MWGDEDVWGEEWQDRVRSKLDKQGLSSLDLIVMLFVTNRISSSSCFNNTPELRQLDNCNCDPCLRLVFYKSRGQSIISLLGAMLKSETIRSSSKKDRMINSKPPCAGSEEGVGMRSELDGLPTK